MGGPLVLPNLPKKASTVGVLLFPRTLLVWFFIRGMKKAQNNTREVGKATYAWYPCVCTRGALVPHNIIPKLNATKLLLCQLFSGQSLIANLLNCVHQGWLGVNVVARFVNKPRNDICCIGKDNKSLCSNSITTFSILFVVIKSSFIHKEL